MAGVDSVPSVDALPEAVLVYSLDTGEIYDVNDRLCGLLDRPAHALRGTDVADIVSAPRDAAPTACIEVERSESGEPTRFEWRIEHGDGDKLPVEAQVTAVERGRREVALASLRELSGRHRNAPEYRSVFERAPIVLWEFDLSEVKAYADRLATETDDVVGYLEARPEELSEVLDRAEVLDVNSEAVEFYGADSKREVVERMDEILTEKALAMWRELCAWLIDEGTVYRTECVAKLLTGERCTLLFETFVADGHAREYDRVYMAGIDISERKQRERELTAVHDARGALQESLADTTSLDAFAEAVCAELTAIDGVALARVCSVCTGDTIDALAVAGEEDITPGTNTDPATAAVRDGTRQRASVETGSPASDVVADPITHDDVTRGAVVVYITENRELPADRLVDLIAESADILGYAMGAADRRRALSADEQVEVTIEVETGGTPLSRVARQTNTAAAVTAAVPCDDETVLCYVTVGDREAASFVAAARETEGIDRIDQVDDNRIQMRTSRPVANTVVAEQGGSVVDASVEATATTLTVRLPRGESVDPVLEALGTQFGDVRASEYTTAPTDSSGSVGDGSLSGLTDRQREVLEAAVHAGYFDRPRTQNATDIATRLGISRQAYSQILRAAQRNLLTDLFDCE